MAYEGMSMGLLSTLLNQLAGQATRDLQANRVAQAEEAWEEAVSMSGYMASVQPRTEISLDHGYCLNYLAETLLRMGASPEAEGPLVQAVDVFRAEVPRSPAEAEPALARALLNLAKVYRGIRFYVDFRSPPITDRESMREYRRARLANGTWGQPMAALSDDEWLGKAEAPLQEAIPILRRLSRAERARFEPMLALALNLLGEAYVRTGRAAHAESPLREAEALYRGLVRDDAEVYQPLLTDTLGLLEQAAQGSALPIDRISALEELLPGLRLEGSLTDEEREHGVTWTKHSARKRLTDALKELASLYEEAGRDEDAREIWDRELGILMTESLPIRLN